MFTRSWLDSLDESELTTLYNDEQDAAKRCRRNGAFGLSHYHYTQAAEVCNAIGRLYQSEAEKSFVRQQMELPSMPSRVAPEKRVTRIGRGSWVSDEI